MSTKICPACQRACYSTAITCASCGFSWDIPRELGNVISLNEARRKRCQPKAQAAVAEWLGRKAHEDNGHTFEAELAANKARQEKLKRERSQANVSVLRSYRIK